MKRILYALAILALATMVGCSSSQATTTVEPGVYYTQAAQTIAVELTRAAHTQAPPPCWPPLR